MVGQGASNDARGGGSARRCRLSARRHLYAQVGFTHGFGDSPLSPARAHPGAQRRTRFRGGPRRPRRPPRHAPGAPGSLNAQKLIIIKRHPSFNFFSQSPIEGAAELRGVFMPPSIIISLTCAICTRASTATERLFHRARAPAGPVTARRCAGGGSSESRARIIIMSRRKQANPQPLRSDEDPLGSGVRHAHGTEPKSLESF